MDRYNGNEYKNYTSEELDDEEDYIINFNTNHNLKDATSNIKGTFIGLYNQLLSKKPIAIILIIAILPMVLNRRP